MINTFWNIFFWFSSLTYSLKKGSSDSYILWIILFKTITNLKMIKASFYKDITNSKPKNIFKRKFTSLKSYKNFTKPKFMSFLSAKSSTNNNSPSPKPKTSPNARASCKKSSTQCSTKTQSTSDTKLSWYRTLSKTIVNATLANNLPFKNKSEKCSIKYSGRRCCKNSSVINCIWWNRLCRRYEWCRISNKDCKGSEGMQRESWKAPRYKN